MMTAVGTNQPGSLTLTFCPRMLWKAKGHWTSRTNSWKMNPLRLLKRPGPGRLWTAKDWRRGEHTGDVFHPSALFLECFLIASFTRPEERYYIACSFGQVLCNSIAIKQFWQIKILVLKNIAFLFLNKETNFLASWLPGWHIYIY